MLTEAERLLTFTSENYRVHGSSCVYLGLGKSAMKTFIHEICLCLYYWPFKTVIWVQISLLSIWGRM